MKLYYRISDKSYDKQKLLGATKEVCLMNFCKAFASVIFRDLEGDPPPVRIIADRCERKTVKMIQGTGLPVTVTDEGNAGSLRKAFEMALAEAQDDKELVYFCEDDYLHLGSAPKLLEEGIKRSDYVTLYDHPDKYTRFYDGGEISKVIKTPSSHWRYTASTCMTFGTKVGTLRDDMDIWNEFTEGDHPHDHAIFMKLAKDKRRRLAVCIPGVACHTDLAFSGVVHHMLIDDWAYDLMIDELSNELDGYECKVAVNDPDSHRDYLAMRESLLAGKTGWEKLIALDALRSQFVKKS